MALFCHDCQNCGKGLLAREDSPNVMFATNPSKTTKTCRTCENCSWRTWRIVEMIAMRAMEDEGKIRPLWFLQQILWKQRCSCLTGENCLRRKLGFGLQWRFAHCDVWKEDFRSKDDHMEDYMGLIMQEDFTMENKYFVLKLLSINLRTFWKLKGPFHSMAFIMKKNSWKNSFFKWSLCT